MTTRVFINSMPKCGTNLLNQVVPALVGGELGRLALYEGHPAQAPDIRAKLIALPAGELSQGHLYFGHHLVELFDDLGLRMAMILRDPRDAVVSLVHYLERLRIPGDPVSEHLNDCVHSRTDRLRAVILGFHHAGCRRTDIAAFARAFLPWEDWPGAGCVRFEELVHPTWRRVALGRLHDELLGPRPADERRAAVARAEAAIDPGRSFTFRSGRIGDWRDEFDPRTKDLFKLVAGDLLIEMGYERDLDW